MNQLTVRGFDPELEHRLRRTAEERGLSLNKAALLLLRRGAGLDRSQKRPPNVVGDSLDELIGVWSAEEEREFLSAVEMFEQIDESFWS